MTDFNQLNDLWGKQPLVTPDSSQVNELIRMADKNTRALKARQIWTFLILSVLVLSLALYFIAFWDGRFNRFFLGLSLMVFPLLLRLSFEYASFTSFRRIDIRSDFKTYTKRMTGYYNRRKKINFIVTPVMALTYVTGFILLLPVFRQRVSTGFYLYIIFSGSLFLIGYTLFQIRLIKKEMELLSFLRNIE
ncbi:MAG: hypothetical protein ABIS69_05415 [Sediminibacterium sp.]